MKHETLTFRFLDMSRGGFARLFLLLLLPCLSVIGVKAADSNGGVKVTFNPAVRYSQWAINSRLHDFKESTNNCGFDLYNKDGKRTEAAAKWNKYDTGLTKRFHYVPGLVAKAILESADFYKGFDWSKPWFYSAQAYAQEVTYNNNTSAPTLDAMNAVKMYFPILSSSLKSSEIETKANTAISKLATDLKNYNEYFSIGGKKSSLKETDANDTQKGMIGGWFHKSTDYVDQMWLDGAYMGSATLAQLAEYYKGNTNIFGSTSADWDMVTKQLNIVWDNCWDSNKQLMYHAFSATGDAKAKSDGTATWAGLSKTAPVYHSAAFWGRANAWYLYALVDALEAMKNCDQVNTENYTTLKTHLEAQAAGILKWQDQQTGGWYQIMDENNTYKANSYSGETWTSSYNNYIETSASTIFAAALFKAVRLGLLGDTYKAAAKKAFEGIVENFVVQDSNNGTINIWSSSLSAGLGGKSYRDGSNEYYILGKDTKRVLKEDNYTEGKVLGGFIMAATEYERAYQNQESKQILFAKDLAPKYDFTTTEGELDATAYGSGDGTITYQWYKSDGAKIANATNATYAPTESGYYYCIATSGNTNITTSTTNVTAKSNSNTNNGSTDNNNGGSDNGTASEGTVTFSSDQLKNYSSPMTDASKVVTITTSKGTIQKESDGDIKVAKDTAFTISVAEGKYIKSITYTINDVSKGELTFSPKEANKVTSSDNLTYTYNYSDNNLSSVTATNSAKKGGIKVTSIKVVYGTISTENKYKVSATAGTGGSVSIANASGTTVTSGTEVEANTSLTFTATPSEGYEFVNWTDASSNEVSTNATYTTTVTAAISLRANFKAKTPVDPTVGEVIYNFTSSTSVGTTTDGTSCSSTNGIITFSSNFSAKDGKYITIKPETGGFKAGDVITLKGYCDSKNLSGVIIYSDVNDNGSSIFKSNVLAKKAAGGSEFTYTLTEDCNALYLGRYGGGTTCLTSLQVNRPASSSGKTRLTASFEHNADVVVKTTTTTTVTLPALTVKAGETTLTADKDYTVVYESNAEGVATLSGNTITINSLGIATITATVTPKNTDTYEGTTATYQLSVKAPSPLNVSVKDVTINTTDAEEEQPVIKVYGDNDKLLTLGQDYTLSFAVSGDNNVSVDASGKFSVKKNEQQTEFIKGTSLITVTATPTASLGSNYTKGTLQFSYSVSEGKIKPVFLESFKDISINLHQDSNNRTITVPLIHDGEDVSSYFNYTYKITAQVNGQTQEVTQNTLNYTPSTTGKYTITVSATPGSDGTDDYSDNYDSPDPISFYLDIDTKYQPISVTPDPANIKMYAGTTQVAPDLTVLLTETKETLDDTKYSTSWFSTSPGVVKVDATTGKIEAVSEGTADIRVVVTGDNLESTTALITVDVDDPAVYQVHANEEYKSQKTMWNQNNNLSVTLGGWLFPGTVDNLWTTDEQLKSTVEWNYDKSQDNYSARKAPWKITGFDYVVKAGDNQKNARQEMGSNSMPETTLISNVDYTKKENIVDPMFNVPCSGSFLVFQPKTNGTVVAHIYQNGVFDSKKNKNSTDYQYRPQRRVFIMDEAGNFVSSDAHIESTTGKPNGKNYTLSDYKWDMGDKKSPTVETVKKHFGLESFEMSETGFKNNVYENQLDQETAPNEAATKYPNLKGSHGWSVLADAPVTYKFNVKAGKTYYLYNFGSKIGFYGFSFEKSATEPTVDEFTFNDNQSNTIKATEDGHVAKVTVNRKMTAGIWTTCVLPFSLNVHQVDAIFGDTYKKGCESGTQILYFDRVENGKVYFVRHAYNTIVANKPFLIKPSKKVESISTAASTEYPYVTIEATKNENGKPKDWCTGNGYTWASSYSNDMTVQEGDGFISNQDGTFKNFVGASGKLKGFRGYLKRINNSAGAKPTMLQVVSSSNVDGNNGETTGIEDLIIDADGQLMPANGKVYNINGQLVSEDANSFQSLPSGIYIINGKKYIK